MRLKKNMSIQLSLFILTGLMSLVAKAGSVGLDIVGGSEVAADPNKMSSTVLIVGEISNPDGSKGQYICTGSLLTTDMAVTAAHCVAEDITHPTDPANMAVIFSNNVTTPNTQVVGRHVAGYVANPGWGGVATAQNDDIADIAVIHFTGGLPPGYAPAQLLTPGTLLTAGEEVVLDGYGITSMTDKDGSSAGVLREVRTTVLQEGKTEVVLDSSKGKGVCSGDSGGPAFVEVQGQRYLWGVTSRTDAACSIASLYTKISSYTDFISGAEKTLESQPVIPVTPPPVAAL
jgi:secreted trypsin-like serine protease